MATDAVKDKATSSLPSVGGNLPSVGGNLPNVGGGLPSVGGLTSAGGITDTTLSTDEQFTAGKVLLKGGSKEDAAIAVAKDRGKDKLKDFGSSTVYGAAPTATTTTTAPVAAPAAPAALAVNCPSGTTAQPNGTCMITGDYQ